MDTKNRQNNLNGLVVIVLAIVLVGLGGYALSSKKTNNSSMENRTTDSQVVSQAQQTQVVPTNPTNDINSTSEVNLLSIKQRGCVDLFDTFKLKALDFASIQQTQSNNYLSISASDFVIGYSPRLNNCIGGYTFKILSNGSGRSSVSYFIVDPKTLLLLKKWPEYNLIKMTYENYRKTLDDITNGQISINNIDPKEDLTPGLMFCNDSYYKCPVGDKPMCNSNNPSSEGWCSSQ